MPTCGEVLARTLREAGVTRMFGLPGGEVLHFLEAARREGIEFILTRHEATASFMADVTGQIERRPGVCLATLGPGAVNMTLGVANAFLDRSPLIAVTAAIASAVAPYQTHQNLDLNAVYRPFTKLTLTLDGESTAAKVRRAWRTSLELRMGPVHLAVPGDVARMPDREIEDPASIELEPSPAGPAAVDAIAAMGGEIRRARRPVVLLGLDLDPRRDVAAVRAFVRWLGAPVFVTPKAKGILPEDNPLFFGVCSGVAADSVILDFFRRADLLIGVGYEPVESNRIWHHTLKLVSIGPVSIAADRFRPALEVVGDIGHSLDVLRQESAPRLDWTEAEWQAFRGEMQQALHPPCDPLSGLSPYEVTRALRQLFPGDTIHVTDVGAVKGVTSQVWQAYEPLTFFESNGLSAMSYGLPGAMAARLAFPGRPILCTVGDGGLGMALADVETAVRHGLRFVTVVYNDSQLSWIQAVQQHQGHRDHGVRYGSVDFAAAARALGAWGRRAASLEALASAVGEAMDTDGPAVIDVPIDPSEYRSHLAPPRGVNSQQSTVDSQQSTDD
jgi:acetolactate synthase-1/2/3 large subunit